jgi:hypothetical protein
MDSTTFFWRRTDAIGLERLELHTEPGGLTASGSVLCLEAGGYRLEHRWRLAADWRVLALQVERWGADGHARLSIERHGERWFVDGAHRPDLDGAEEPDLSVTPFCNTVPIRRLPTEPGATLTLDTCYVDGPAMTVERSSQRYVRLGPHRVRYVDLGVASGFEAELELDDAAVVLRYEHLFERVAPPIGG